jgi:hypothetical protein
VNSLPGLFFPRFLHNWAAGMSAAEATRDAYRLAIHSAEMLNSYLKSDDLLSSVGIQRSEPVLAGVDVDRKGAIHTSTKLRIDSMVAPRPAVDRPRYKHTSFEHFSIQMLSGMLPQSSLDADSIPSAQALVDQVSGPAWDGLRDSFPSPSMGLPGILSGSGDEIWVDGEALRFFLAPVRDWAGEKGDLILDHLQGARVERVRNSMTISVYFDQELTVSVQDEKKAKNWELYAIHVPKTIRFTVSMFDGIVFVSGLDTQRDNVKLSVKIPWLPDTVYLRTASVNLVDGKLRVEAGVIGDTIGIVANAQLAAKTLGGVDIWETIKDNLDLLVWPILVFAVL